LPRSRGSARTDPALSGVTSRLMTNVRRMSALIAKIFEPFWRHSTSASRDGLGPGLHLCADRARARGNARSTIADDAGTRFTARTAMRTV
jgi:hypothetical protein